MTPEHQIFINAVSGLACACLFWLAIGGGNK